MIRDTSVKTYAQIIEEGLVSKNHERVMEAIKNLRNGTDMEITKFLGLTDPNKVRPRRKELVDMGIVTEYGKRPCSVTKREAYTWGIAQTIIFRKLREEKIPCPQCHGTGYIIKYGEKE